MVLFHGKSIYFSWWINLIKWGTSMTSETYNMDSEKQASPWYINPLVIQLQLRDAVAVMFRRLPDLLFIHVFSNMNKCVMTPSDRRRSLLTTPICCSQTPQSLKSKYLNPRRTICQFKTKLTRSHLSASSTIPLTPGGSWWYGCNGFTVPVEN